MRSAVVNRARSKLIALGLLFFFVGCGAPSAPNTRIAYTFAGTASGSLGNVSFTDAPFTLVVTADTRAVTPSTNPCAVPGGVCHIFLVPAATVKFSLTQQNVSATFTSTAGIFVNQTYPTVGLQRRASSDMLDIQDQAFATYELKTAIGPVGSLSVVLGQFNCNFGCVETTLGVLTVNSVAKLTFAASSAP